MPKQNCAPSPTAFRTTTMTDEIIKKWGIWGLIAAAAIGALWWLVQWSIERGTEPAAVVGMIESPPGSVTVILDNGAKKTVAHETWGWFRLEEVTPGQHLIEYRFEGFHP